MTLGFYSGVIFCFLDDEEKLTKRKFFDIILLSIKKKNEK